MIKEKANVPRLMMRTHHNGQVQGKSSENTNNVKATYNKVNVWKRKTNGKLPILA